MYTLASICRLGLLTTIAFCWPETLTENRDKKMMIDKKKLLLIGICFMFLIVVTDRKEINFDIYGYRVRTSIFQKQA